jgi:hypothetical protein
LLPAESTHNLSHRLLRLVNELSGRLGPELVLKKRLSSHLRSTSRRGRIPTSPGTLRPQLLIRVATPGRNHDDQATSHAPANQSTHLISCLSGHAAVPVPPPIRPMQRKTGVMIHWIDEAQ